MNRDEWRKFAAECVGTFVLVFAGTGAIISNDVSDGVITHLGISLTFGLTVLALIYALGDVSGCHLNPAVTIGFLIAGRFERRLVLPYILSQCAGGLIASLLLRYLFTSHSSLGATLPAVTLAQAFLIEFVLSGMLMFIILCVSTGSKEQGIMAGVAVGAIIAVEAMFAGPLTGASMNPARSIAPAIVAMRFESLWLYILAPIAGAWASVFLHQFIYGRDIRRPSHSHSTSV